MKVMQSTFIKRSGITAASFLIATLAIIITHASPASALLDVKLPLGENVSPITDRVNGLVNKSLGLPITVDSADSLRINTANRVDIDTDIPVVPTVVDAITEPLSEPIEEVTSALQPVTDNTVPATHQALSRVFTTTPAQQPQVAVSPSTIPSTTKITLAKATNPKGSSPAHQPARPEGVALFFGSLFPTTLQDVARSLVGKEVGMLPITISILLLLVTFGSIVGIVYISERGGTVTIGQKTFVLFANGKDNTDLAMFIIVVICFGTVAVVLTPILL